MSGAVPPKLPLSDAQLESLCKQAEILEQDANGLKVLKLQDGNILKMFRVKRWWSSAQLYAYSRHFCRNAARLAARGIPTVSIQARYKLASPGLTAVLYQPLQGRTLRQVAGAEGLGAELPGRLGAFVAILHRQGIYFRSLHLGNVVLTPAGDLGLIDIADLSILPFPLTAHRRLRNFRHLCRLRPDRLSLGADGWRRFVDAYCAASAWGDARKRKFAARAEQLYAERLRADPCRVTP